MRYIQCDETEATHVKILEDEDDFYEVCNVTIGNVYTILRNDDPSFKGEEMIENDKGDFLCSFSLVLDVQWLKEVN